MIRVQIISETMPRASRTDFDLATAPGHLLRRAQQRAVDIFADEVGPAGPTPPQFALLAALDQRPGSSQIALVREIGIDRSTLAEMVRRLVRRGLVASRRSEGDGRQNALALTEAGRAMLAIAQEGAQRTQQRILAPVPPAQRSKAVVLLRLLADLPAGSPRKTPRSPRR